MIFDPRSPIDTSNQRTNLNRACELAGVPAPTAPYTEVSELILGTTSVATIAREYAEAAYQTDNPEKLVADAIDALKHAQAGEALRDAFVAAEPVAAKTLVPEMIDKGIDAIRPEFDKDMAKLAKAARKLDANNPLDAELAVAADAGRELTTAREILAKLNVYATINTNHFLATEAPMQLRKLLTIIDLPDIVQEQCHRALYVERQTANPDDIEGTLTVRELGQDATSNLDATILGIARGDYKGVTLTLTKRQDVPRNAEALRRAHVIKYIPAA